MCCKFLPNPPPRTQWRFESKKRFHNVKIKIIRVSGYAIMSDHNDGFFWPQSLSAAHNWRESYELFE